MRAKLCDQFFYINYVIARNVSIAGNINFFFCVRRLRRSTIFCKFKQKMIKWKLIVFRGGSETDFESQIKICWKWSFVNSTLRELFSIWYSKCIPINSFISMEGPICAFVIDFENCLRISGSLLKSLQTGRIGLTIYKHTWK